MKKKVKSINTNEEMKGEYEWPTEAKKVQNKDNNNKRKQAK